MNTSAASRVLALGDSYTVGERVGAEERWPVRLAIALRAGGLDIQDTLIVAKTGWTVAELAAGIDDASPHGPYDLVTLLIGVNDQYRGGSAEGYRAPFVALFNRAKQFAAGRAAHVIVLSIPDWGVTPFAAASGQDRTQIAREIDAFNAINRDEAMKAGARYVDVTAVSRRALREPDLLAADGLHPSGKLYAEWVKLLLPVAREVLTEREEWPTG